ncbi:hypothetical protein MKK69_14750 [Methylobacterium sp. J-026]|uniref:hypothetical protein n=1 Tax=Methylobacterium sp. J-026 TaxID=2836624 RepID=UPI001FB95E29|nr:hypothetical protein [Methylobacterium sp. J-026]MCJ2135297.1 hypothetical protein [Methylobacterium sp. J-026]
MRDPDRERGGSPETRRPRQCDMLFDGSFRGKGWFPTEKTPQYYFRWMSGESSATIELSVDRRAALEILVYVPYIIDFDKWDALSFAVDGVPTPFVRENTAVQQSVEMNYYTLRVPAAPHHQGVTELRIDAPFGGRPSLGDPRRLSIGVCRVSARPSPHPSVERARASLDAAVAAYLHTLADHAPVRVVA